MRICLKQSFIFMLGALDKSQVSHQENAATASGQARLEPGLSFWPVGQGPAYAQAGDDIQALIQNTGVPTGLPRTPCIASCTSSSFPGDKTMPCPTTPPPWESQVSHQENAATASGQARLEPGLSFWPVGQGPAYAQAGDDIQALIQNTGVPTGLPRTPCIASCTSSSFPGDRTMPCPTTPPPWGTNWDHLHRWLPPTAPPRVNPSTPSQLRDTLDAFRSACADEVCVLPGLYWADAALFTMRNIVEKDTTEHFTRIKQMLLQVHQTNDTPLPRVRYFAVHRLHTQVDANCKRFAHGILEQYKCEFTATVEVADAAEGTATGPALKTVQVQFQPMPKKKQLQWHFV